VADWKSVEISTEPLLEKVQPVIDSITAVLDYLITILSIAQAILNIIKAFLVGFLDPIRAIVELIISTIQDLIADLRQLGLYFAGDWALLRSEDKFSAVVGGYSAYERRMISRLVDTSDPGRPDFTTNSIALGVFFYVSSGDISLIIRLIRAILRFFGNSDLMGNSMPYGTPTAPEILYGTDGAGVASFRQLSSLSEVPGAMTLTWAMPAGAGGIGQSFSPAPKGFLIHVSTIPDGFQVIGSAAQPSTADVENVPRVIVAGIDPLTNAPLKLYGGVGDLETGIEDFSDVERTESQQAPLLFLQQNTNTPLLKPSTLVVNGAPIIANTFYVKTGFVSKLGGGSTFSATILKRDLPLHATFVAGPDGYGIVKGSAVEATKYWVRIRALTKDYVDELLPGVVAPLRAPADTFAAGVPRPYWFPAGAIIQATGGVLLPFGPSSVSPDAGWMSMTPASGASLAELPSAAQMEYKQAVQVAIALAILCRADLTEGNEGETLGLGVAGSFKYGTYAAGQGLLGLESAGRDLMARYGVNKTFFRGMRPQRFRMKVRNLLTRVATDLATRGPVPPSVAVALEKQSKALLKFTWSQIDPDFGLDTILGSLSSDSEVYGVGGNPYCRFRNKRTLDAAYDVGGGPPRSPAFSVQAGVSPTQWIPGGGSSDYSPILYNDTTDKVVYVRNAISRYDSGALLVSAVQILQLASAWVSRPIGDSGWTPLRLIPQALAPLDELLERLDRFLQGVLDGLQGIIDKIIAFIEAIQARIYQLQALLVKIRAILNSLKTFRIGPASALVLVENGTDGLIAGLASAGNKPQDSPTDYGAGVVVVAGGLPSVLLELLRVVFSGGDD
jgi:hypothetical protein